MNLVLLTVGPDKRVFTVLPAPHSSEEAIPKARAFDDLLSKLLPFEESLGSCHILRAIADHVPTPSVQAEQEAETIVTRLRAKFLEVGNIEPINFIDPAGNPVLHLSLNPAQRVAVAFVEVNVKVVPSTVDQRLADISPFCKTCLLRLPLSLRPSATGQPAVASPPANPSPPLNRVLALSPSMQRLTSTSTAAAAVRTYVGDLDFDTDQAKFVSIFGSAPSSLVPVTVART